MPSALHLVLVRVLSISTYYFVLSTLYFVPVLVVTLYQYWYQNAACQNAAYQNAACQENGQALRGPAVNPFLATQVVGE